MGCPRGQARDGLAIGLRAWGLNRVFQAAPAAAATAEAADLGDFFSGKKNKKKGLRAQDADACGVDCVTGIYEMSVGAAR